MKKQAGIVIAVLVTVLTMGTAFAIQHYASASQPVSEQVTSRVSSSSSTATSSVSQQAATASRTTSKKQATKTKRAATSSHVKRHQPATSRATRTRTSKRHQTSSSTKQAQSSHVTRRATKQSSTTKTTKSATATKKTATPTVHLVVSGYHKTFYDGRVKINSKSTAFSVLQASKLKLVYQNGVAVYVSSVNGLAENDVKVGSGWKFRVNGKFIDKAANKKAVVKNDTVHWYFTTKGY